MEVEYLTEEANYKDQRVLDIHLALGRSATNSYFNNGKAWWQLLKLRFIKLGVKKIHSYLLQSSKPYLSWFKWEYRRQFQIIASSLASFVFITALIINLANVSALSVWSQTDWSGGNGGSTTNQYSSSTSMNTSVNGEVSIATTGDWYNDAWLYRQKITINHDKIVSDLTNFPVYVNMANFGSDFFDSVLSDCGDIRITTATGIEVPREIVNCDTSAEIGQLDFLAPSLSSSIDSEFYIYYDNPSANNYQTTDSYGRDAVWVDYEAVLHLASDQFIDSTGNGHNPTNHGVTITSAGNRKVADFDGSSYLDFGNDLNMNLDDLSISSFIKTNHNSSASMSILAKSYYSGEDSRYGMLITNTGQVTNLFDAGANYNVQGSPNLVDGNTHQVATTFDRNADNTLYIDGVEAGTANINPVINFNFNKDNNLYIGAYNDTTGYSAHSDLSFHGEMFEVRFSNLVLSSDWIETENNNQNDPTSFKTISPPEGRYSTSSTLNSNIYDTGLFEDWVGLEYDTTAPTGTSVSVKVRTGNQSDLSDAPDFSTCPVIGSNNPITSSCAPDRTKYVQYQLNFTSDSTATPIFKNIAISYSPSDVIQPITNASDVKLYKTNGGIQLNSNDFINFYPYATWTAGSDNNGGSGIAGYCLYLGQDQTGNPRTSKGYLGDSPMGTNNVCQFAVSTTSVDLASTNMIGQPLASSTSPYYLNVLAIDAAGNVFGSNYASFQFKFDDTEPDNPAFVSAPSQFVSSKTVNLTWPTNGGGGASDSDSGVAGLQYKIGSSGTWYGANHSGDEDINDLLSNSGSYTTQQIPDFADLQEGNNLIYFRTWDNAGNASSAHVTTVIKLNTSAPSEPQNLTASPNINTANAFTFNWLKPSSFQGAEHNITYCYSVNVIPNANNCIFTDAGQTSLPVGAYATSPGQNTIYVVARDEAGNINYATAGSTTFTANTPAPGVPLNLDAADISVKAKNIWKIALSWEKPTNEGAGIANYRVLRSTNNSNFTKVATTAGASFVDTGLSQQAYFYKVKACDSANNCGVETSSVNIIPTGKFTTAANLTIGPKLSTTTRSAKVSWITDRNSDSQVEYGLKSGHYFSTAAANADQTTDHSIVLNNLDAGTTYFYRAKWTDTDGNTGSSVEGKFTTKPAPTISDVKASEINLHTATISFKTEGSSAVNLYYGPDGNLGNVKKLNTSTSASSYILPLDNLVDGTTYTYRLNPIDNSGYEYKNSTSLTFNTPPAPRITNVEFEPVPGALTGTEKVSWTTNVPTTSIIIYQAVENGTPRQIVTTKLTTKHEVIIDGLTYDTRYRLIATSRDQLGNSTNSDAQIFSTGLDTRPPTISSVVVQPSIQGTGASSSGQITVTWKTDKPSGSQVAYGAGSDGGYTSKTAEDTTMVTNHVVVISDLPTSQVFHVKALSRDSAGNVGESASQTTIIGQATDSALGIVFNALRSVFGL